MAGQSKSSIKVLAVLDKTRDGNGFIIRAIRNGQVLYILVPADIFPSGWDKASTSPEPDLSIIPESDNCKVWTLSASSGIGCRRVIQARGNGIPKKPLEGVTGIDDIRGSPNLMTAEYSEFTPVKTWPASGGRRTDRVQAAKHPKLKDSVVIKIVEIPDHLPIGENDQIPLGTGEAEMRTEITNHYKMSSLGLAPKFIGLVTEQGRGVIGYIMENIRDCQSYEEIKAKAKGKLPPAEIKNVLAVVDQMHRLGIYHGDLHLGNLLKRADGSITIIDFQHAQPLGPNGHVEGKPILSAENEREELEEELDEIGVRR
ncbi:hypothetical protein PFICI_11195 [Pestalotiopsis fici W106-1]|uniref:Protein kinase domain-containing protein n=1 Tax=Pestalotiopsis fici (strain W106-1 / CGMCC3.15140) TaxID=1229662 RepID=W3WWS3_PESFW|nr:uncharacterized protein PFICI_11195 [Pestalotiopsis fici W106-1]ETS77321.1 hypothetical protein PFICI_11195 [Pestalotiopsis fici W106-1]